jgi:pimeloyl-ACP methyl ester carboxylesterase
MDDVRAVMDAAGSTRAVLLGASEGGPMSILFAATYPQRVRALILYGAYAHFHTWVMGRERLSEFMRGAESSWAAAQVSRALRPAGCRMSASGNGGRDLNASQQARPRPWRSPA